MKPLRVGVVGCGEIAQIMHLPYLAELPRFEIGALCDLSPTVVEAMGERYGVADRYTDYRELVSQDDLDIVAILTLDHFDVARAAIDAGKHVFVEKPLALRESDLDELEEAAARSGRHVMVGFNRRFAPLAAETLGLLSGRAGPLAMVMTVNAGAIPRDHWTQDPLVGGGRIVGEACHWMDLARYLAQSPIADVRAVSAATRTGEPIDDIANIAMTFVDGSTAVVHYLANGAKSFPKERIDCFFDGKTVAIDNWRRLHRFGVPGGSRWFERAGKMDKGHPAEIAAWVGAIRKGGPAPIPPEELFEVSRCAIRAGEMALAR